MQENRALQQKITQMDLKSKKIEEQLLVQLANSAVPKESKTTTPSSTVFNLTYGKAFSQSWGGAIAPLYDTSMGCEHMSRVLYALVRFMKPKKVLEVGAGYTSIYILQAMRDNIDEMVRYQQLNEAGFEWPKLGWLVDSYLKQYHHGRMYCIDNLKHVSTTAHKVAEVAATLGLEDLMDIR